MAHSKQSSDPDRRSLSEKKPSPVIWHGSIAYDGSDFCGWQIQTDVRTVQGELTRRLRLMYDDPSLKLAGTSRTDAGVHALDQHFSFADPQPGRYSEGELEHRLRRWLPEDIYLKSLKLADSDFHARHSPLGKGYTYTLSTRDAVSPFHSRYVWHCPRKLHVAAIRQAAACLVGTHDFTALSSTPSEPVDDPVKTVYSIDLLQDGSALYFNVVGQSFLYKMVRSIVGYLVLNVGQDADWNREKTEQLLASARRCHAVQTAPARGLFLGKVFFSEEERLTYQPVLPPFLVPRPGSKGM